MRKAWLRLKIFVKNIQLARNPERTDLVFDIGDALYALGAFGETMKRLSAEPMGARTLQERKLLAILDLNKLSELPKGSLGREYADHMKALGLDPNFYRVRPISDDLSFMMMRMRQTHDLWHVVTGFKTDINGEIGLQAFMMAYMALPLTFLLVAASLIKAALFQPTKMGDLIDSVARGMALARSVKGLFAFDWERNWARPLSDVQAELGLAQR